MRLRNELCSSYFVRLHSRSALRLSAPVSFYISYKTMPVKAEAASQLLIQQIEKNMDNDFHSKRNLLLASL